ncbi:hypothetical protein Tsubulata_037919 [Turnera subulata]|uniref:NAC domain-containing protein n=1 Tax=Turnera subulata TaxID=218843 RepID=A0A9Q0JKH0_9ROSI|nr:hypothetical protein Tsubulata_037919 [Turnera subulata]
MEMESCVPPGFRFHPTEEELVGYYLKRKIHSLKIDLQVIVDIDLYKMEPWDIQARCKLGYDEQNEWYFFSHKDRKYPTGTRTNRATAAGFWKATGRDKAVVSKNKEEGWVVCRAFKKPTPNQRPGFETYNTAYYHINHMMIRPPTANSSLIMANPNQSATFHQPFGLEPADLVSSHSFLDINNSQSIELPQLDSPTTHSTSFATKEGGGLHHNSNVSIEDYDEERSNSSNQCIDWKNLDNLLASQVNDTTNSFPNPSLPSISQNYDDHQGSHVSHYLGCFPDL